MSQGAAFVRLHSCPERLAELNRAITRIEPAARSPNAASAAADNPATARTTAMNATGIKYTLIAVAAQIRTMPSRP